ncbi:MAG: NAD-dependent epimerase/dehydratase [Acidimicrobiaceae bacterium]|nr:NAD-dependent epimerase/dehydratase [Acidimicrobiaceae bacterium]
MRVLVTGHRGKLGARVAQALGGAGHEIVGFEVADGADLLDARAVGEAAAGCGAVVHLAALANDGAGTPEQIMAVNLLGTWHVLLAAEAQSLGRVVHFSSAQVFGASNGEGLPDYFPVDDAHPRRAGRPYGLSKRLGEDLWEAFTARTGTPTVVLRPVRVLEADEYEEISRSWVAQPSAEWEPFWEFGSVVDVRDVAEAVLLALEPAVVGHVRALLCSADVAASAPSLEMLASLAPQVPVRDRKRYEADPWAALVDCSVAQGVLGWHPRHRWSDGGGEIG